LPSASVSRLVKEGIVIKRFLIVLASLVFCWTVTSGWGQMSSPMAGRIADGINQLPDQMMTMEGRNWHVVGRVRSLQGKPVPQANVHLDFGPTSRTVKSDLQGRFEVDVELNNEAVVHLGVRATVSCRGYWTAHEETVYPDPKKTWPIEILLLEKKEVDDQLPLASLTEALAPKLRAAVEAEPKGPARHKEFGKAMQQLLTRHNAQDSVPYFYRVVEQSPKCLECHVLFSLALLQAGRWASALRELNTADALNKQRPKDSQLAAPAVTFGVIEEWAGGPLAATNYLSQALALGPNNGLALQEMGRSLIALKDYQRASDYLNQALQNGVSDEARVLLVSAQLGLSKTKEAQEQMALYLKGKRIKSAPPEARYVYGRLEQRMKLEDEFKGLPLMNASLPELEKAIPELAGLEPATSQDALPAILAKTEENVDKFFKLLPNVYSSEQIRADKIGKHGKVEDSQEKKFNYFVTVQSAKTGVCLTEYRSNAAGEDLSDRKPEEGHMLTKGFTALTMLFGSNFQAGSRFRYLGEQIIGGHKTQVIAFSQKPESAQPLEEFIMKNYSESILQQGVAWIDAETYQLVRLRTDLLQPMPRLGLRKQTTVIIYDEVKFRESPLDTRLPSEVVVTVELRDKTFHNLHRYSDFRLFHVDTSERIKAPKNSPGVATVSETGTGEP
jgi:tetratricopeptide (TPR) repeat protein